MEDSRAPIVSVIIPIYNVEDYLAECLDSVLAQSLGDIEVICVNDGSTDSSLDIIREYESLDPRITVIDKPNGGYGQAVNRGLSIARGEWIAIVEPDDLIDPRMYEDLSTLGMPDSGQRIDIVKGSYWHYFHFEGEEPYVERPNLMNCMSQGVCELNLWEDPEMLRHHPSIWSAIYRRAFIEENGIRMIEPKGAGWADNPWLFDTMLRAERIIWTPAPYYYYRQTNPDASSNLKDYHLPFDRLRDIRAIYRRLGIDNEKLLWVLYHRSFNYICTSILEEFEFPEGDPELQKLIREVFESFDEDVLMDGRNGIPQGRKNYYNDFMGNRLKKVKAKKRPENPQISFILPMKNDRRGLWETLNGLLRQSYENFEVICIDCSSKDRSLQIATDLSQVDERFSTLSGCGSISEGCTAGLEAARGEYVMFLRSGAAFEDWSVVRTLVDRFETMHEATDMVIFKAWFPASRLIPRGSTVVAVPVETEGIECDVALSAFPHAYTRLFRRKFLVEEGICLTDPRDEECFALCVKAAARARTAAFVAGRDMRVDTRNMIDRGSLRSGEELTKHMLDKYDVFARAAEEIGTEAAWRVARGCIVCHMAIDVAKIGQNRSGRKYFEALRDVFESKYGIKDAPLSDFANYLDFGVLEEAFSLDYDDYAAKLLTRQQQSLIDLTWQRDQSNRALTRIHQSGSYIFGKEMARIAKSVVPRKARQEYSYQKVHRKYAIRAETTEK